MMKAVLERALQAELTDHLGYEAGDPAGRGIGWTAALEFAATSTRRLTSGARKKPEDVYVVFTAPDGNDQEIATVPAGHEASAREWVANYNRTVRPQ